MFIAKKTISCLLVTCLLLPVGIAFLFFFGRLALAFGGTDVSALLDAAAFLLLFGWVMDSVALVAALAVNEIGRRE